MKGSLLAFAAVLFVVVARPALAAEQKCELQRYAELPVTMSGTQPLISGTINGRPARFLADSGAFFSVLAERSALKLDLRVGLPPRNIRLRGTGGSTSVGFTKVKEFTLAGFAGGRVIPNVEFLVDEISFAGDFDGVIGQNVIGNADTEFDLANGMIRLFRAKNCDGSLAYWARNAPVATMKINKANPARPHLIGEAKLNGKKIRVMFDTGAWRSKLSLDAAARAGVEREDDGVIAAEIGRGFGPKTNENSLARFDSLDLGGEVIKNARLRIGDMNLDIADMLLGADFFLSHRVYVSSSQDRIFFTYNGGPVFDLRRSANDPKSKPTGEAVAASTADEHPALTADELKRRGTASAARRDFDAAIAAFDKSLELNANDAETFYQRGVARWASGQPRAAAEDFDAALKLAPNHVDALVSRGSLRLRSRNEVGASADFQEALRLEGADPLTVVRIAQAYDGVGNFAASVERLSAWVSEHPKNDRLSSVLTSRCWSRAMLGKELELAREDCDQAIKKGPRNSSMFDNRGLVWLQLGNLDKAIADYKEALELQPKKATALYGLGIAEIKKGQRESGERNMQAAVEIAPQVAVPFRRIGLMP